MRSRLLPALVAGTLSATLLGAQTAAAEPREVRGPSLPAQASQTAAEHAADALAQAQALFAEKSRVADVRPDATMVLNALMRAYGDLSPADKEVADRLLARPTAPGGDGLAEYTVREAKPHCGGAVCIHYVRRTTDAPPRADSDGDGVPNAVEHSLTLARAVHSAYTSSGYRRPDPDGKRGGHLNKVDVYLADIGDQGLYGYCTSDQPPKNNGTYNYWAYCAIDDDFARSQFGTNTPSENRKVTLAHEYFHAVQYAYDASEDGWFMESTATWAEDEVYDAINDNRQYLLAGQLGAPRVPLDKFGVSGNQYGNWLFFRYLTEQHPQETGSLPTLVLDMWERASGRAGAADLHSTAAVEQSLAAVGTVFQTAYGDFSVANRNPSDVYEEGSAYVNRVASPNATHALTAAAPEVQRSISLSHLTSVPVRLVPGSDLGNANRVLDITVDMPSSGTAPFARVIVQRADGSLERSAITLSADGAGTATVPFTPGQVSRVELVLGNASLRTTCWQGTSMACQGNPLDDNLPATYQAVTSPS